MSDTSQVRKTDFKIAAVDGTPLAASLYERFSKPTAGVVIINSATGVRRHFYDAYARYLATNGFHAVTYDYRGVGDSRPSSLRGFNACVQQWGQLDVDGVIAWASERYPNEKLNIVGHSVGGVLLGLTSNTDLIDRAVFVAPQSGYWRLLPAPYKQAWAFLWYVANPVLTKIFGYFPAKRLGLGEDLPAGVMSEFGLWACDPEYIVSATHGVSRSGFERIRAPVLAYSIEDDTTAPRAAFHAILELYTNAHIERRHLKPQELGMTKIGHFGFFRLGPAVPVWAESCQWLTKKEDR